MDNKQSKWTTNGQQIQHMKVSKCSTWKSANTVTNGQQIQTWKSHGIDNMEGVVGGVGGVGVVGGNIDGNMKWFVTHVDFRFTL